MKRINIATNVQGFNVVLFLIVIFVYRFLLDIIYRDTITPFFDYQNFVYDKDLTKYFLSWCWVLLIAIYDFKLYKDEKSSSLMMLFFDIFYFIPLTSISSLANFNYSFILYAFVFWLLMSILQSRHTRVVQKKNECNLNFGILFCYSAWFFVLLNTLLTIYFNGFHIKFDLSDIYDLRQEARDMNLPAIYGYIKPIGSRITVLLLVLYLLKHKYKIVALLAIIQLMNFAFGAMKGDLFTLVVAIIVGLFYNYHRKKFILYGLMILVIASIIEFIFLGFSSISLILFRRMFFMPSLLSYEYFEYFSDHTFLYLRDSILRWVGFESPYDVSVPFLIGSEVYGKPDMSSNTGILGDDFAQFGWLSLFLYPLLRVKLLHYTLDKIEHTLPIQLTFFLCFSYVFSFISGSFFSIMLTGGYIPIYIILRFYKTIVR